MTDDTYVAQEGGDHYQAEYQHWDWVVDVGIGYLAGCATKYVSRWRKKNGLQDLQKAMTYVDKMIATRKNSDWHYKTATVATKKLTDRFILANELEKQEAEFCVILAGACPPDKLRAARAILDALIQSAQTATSAAPRAAGPAVRASTTTGAQQALRSGQRVRAGGRPGLVGYIASELTVEVQFGPGDSAPFRADQITILPSDGMEHPFGYDEEKDA